MPQPKPLPVKHKATVKDVKQAASVGNAVFEFFQKNGTFPSSSDDISLDISLDNSKAIQQ